MKKFFVLIGALGLFSIPAMAEEPIGGSYYVNNSANTNITIFSSTNNVNGLHIRTLAMACSSDSSIQTTPPITGATPRVILLCNYGSTTQGVASLPYPLYLPPGYSLQLVLDSPNQNQIYITYDLNSQ